MMNKTENQQYQETHDHALSERAISLKEQRKKQLN
jgi:hypothetical protein